MTYEIYLDIFRTPRDNSKILELYNFSPALGAPISAMYTCFPGNDDWTQSPIIFCSSSWHASFVCCKDSPDFPSG